MSLGKVLTPRKHRAMLITVGWASLAALFSFSIAMVVWGRHGDGSINF
jgi:cytochrome b6-f complex subunit 8